MNDQPLLTVRGEVVWEVEPEIARFSVTVAAKDADRATTLQLLNERATSVTATLSSLGDAIEAIETSGMQIAPQFKDKTPGERTTGYIAQVRVTIIVAHFDRIGEIVAQLADHDLTEIHGPWWSLRPDSQVFRHARIEAVNDSVRRAKDYVSALGSSVTGLVELADAGLLADGHDATNPMMASSARRAMSSGRPPTPDELTFDITPGKQTVRVTVEARFRITAPDLAT